MNNIKKTALLYFVVSFTLFFISFSFNKGYSQSTNANKEDFSDAQNAEEKRSKWGTEEFKLELIKEMSTANIALFIDEHLDKINEPSRIFYRFQKESTREDNFIGNVVLNIVKVADDNTKHITFRYLKGRNKVRFPPQIGAKGNPVFMLFFERDSRDMQRLTGGNALFFRSRIRHAIAATDIKESSFEFDDKIYESKEIIFRPFTETKLKNRVSRYQKKKFTVILSDDIPGGIFKIESESIDENSGDKVKETLTFLGVKTNKQLRDEYKLKQEKTK